MKRINAEELTPTENYKLLSGSIIPRPIAFVTTLSSQGVLNAAPFSFFNVVTNDPPLISISVQRDKGARKDTAINAIDYGEFVVHISDDKNIIKINETAKRLPPARSEVEDTGLTPVDSYAIKVPGIVEAKIRMECILESCIPLGGTDGEATTDLLIGQVVCYHIEEGVYKSGQIDAKNLAPVARLAGNNYAKLGEFFELVRPT